MGSLAEIVLQHQLILISDDADLGGFIPERHVHNVSIDDKLACLPGIDVSSIQSYLATEPLAKLWGRAHGSSWEGLDDIKRSPQQITSSDDFTRARIAQVNDILAKWPYVFLTGLSGVGKSTFVEREFCTQADKLYRTEDAIEDWAKDRSGARKILFIDEANLSPRQWSEFEGLFQTPAHILVNGVLYPLTSQHKVIFAGNPLSYGDERRLAPFFERHGHALLFTPLPPAFIAEKVLQPLFADTGIEAQAVIKMILAAYQFIGDCSTTELLISPRELEMMALLTINKAKQCPSLAINDIAAHYIYQLGINLLPEAKQRQFERTFKPRSAIEAHQTKMDDFLVTPSRQTVSQLLDDLLSLHEARPTLSGSQQTAGLGGIIIEGAPGIGKSELVINTLRAWGYEEEHAFTAPTKKEKPFYNMPVSMPLAEKEQLLIKAFNEGAIVMIDEINSSPMMESLLNDLLMGKNPKAKLGDEDKPGFMLIGTQNPVTMAGRKIISTALQRRLINITLPEYTTEELKPILCAKGVPQHEAVAMIETYTSQRAYAKQHQLSPVPNFRHLMTCATQYLKSTLRSKAAAEQEDSYCLRLMY